MVISDKKSVKELKTASIGIATLQQATFIISVLFLSEFSLVYFTHFNWAILNVDAHQNNCPSGREFYEFKNRKGGLDE